MLKYTDEVYPEYGGVYEVKATGFCNCIYLEEKELDGSSWSSKYFIDVKTWGKATRAVIALKIELGFNTKAI